MAHSDELPWVDARDFLLALAPRNLTFSGNEASFSCFSGAHTHGDSSPSAGMNLTTTRWQCRSPSCGLKGNAADFLAKLRGYTREQAMRILAERYGGPEISTAPGALEQEVERIRNQRQVELPERKMISDEEYLDRFAFHWPSPDADLPEPIAYMYGRGFTPEILNRWLIGFDDGSGRITIPIHDEDGQLVGIKGRACRREIMPRYISIGDTVGREDPRYGFNTYMKSQYVFGLNRARESSCVVVVEGELNAIALSQIGIDAVAIAGAEFSPRQRELIASKFSEVILYFDNDLAGYTATQKVGEMLAEDMAVWVAAKTPGDAADALDPSKDFSISDLQQAVIMDAKSFLSYKLDLLHAAQ